MAKTKAESLADECVIYWSPSDDCWIAHSLHTDQIGMGDNILDALTDMLRAVRQVISLASHDASIEIRREAPARIHKLVQNAATLPKPVYEIALEMAEGHWPKYMKPTFGVTVRRRFATDLEDIEEGIGELVGA